MWDQGYTKCSCPVVIRGTLPNGKFLSLSTAKYLPADKARNMEAAQELALLWFKNDGPVKPTLPTPTLVPEDCGQVTVEHAVQAYIQDGRDRGNDEATLQKKEFIFARTAVVEWRAKRKGEVRPSKTVSLLGFCADKGIRFLSELTLPEIREWRARWTDGTMARRKKQGRVIGFFWFCERNAWCPAHFADDITRGLGKIEGPEAPTGYFEPEEYKRLLDATYIYTDQGSRYGGLIGGERIRAVMELMRWSGLAIRDAVCLERSRLANDPKTGVPAIMVQRSKKRDKDEGWIYVLIPPHVAEQLRTVPPGPRPNPRYFFWSGEGLKKSAVANWQRSFRRLFKLAELKLADGSPKRCHPHMFRDTWAVESLLNNMDIRDVAEVLGHQSVKTTERHYTPWVRARQTHLNNAMMESMVRQGVLPLANASETTLKQITELLLRTRMDPGTLPAGKVQ
jgi:integrase